MINDNYKKFGQTIFKGMNLDTVPDKLSPEFLSEVKNMEINEKGVLSTINGCKRAIIYDSHNPVKLGFFSTRGEDYIFIYDDNNQIRIYKYPTLKEETSDWTSTDVTLREMPWFAEHSGEFWFGNMTDGVWRWRPGNQALRQGGAPADILVGVGEEGEAEKSTTEWYFAYDYEYRGGRSPLSRMARARLYDTSNTVKVNIDLPPDISKNRRIYASTNAGTTWYFVKEVTDNTVLEIELDDELVDRIASSYVYIEDAEPISPRAKFGISYGDRLWLAYLLESPTLVQYSEIGTPYFDETSYFDLGDPITNIMGYRENVVVSTTSRIFGLQFPDKATILANEGAFYNSMQVIRGTLVYINEQGVHYLKGDGTSETIPGINTYDFSGLEKEKRFFLWTSQQDFEKGTYEGGMSGDTIIGALTLNENKVKSMKGLLAETTTYSSDCVETKDGSICQGFQLLGNATETVTLTGVSLLIEKMKNAGNEDPFLGEIREDDGDGEPDMTPDGLVSAFEGNTQPNKVYLQKFLLSQESTINKGTLYWIVVPSKGEARRDWKIYGNDWDRPPFYPRGRAYWSEGGGSSWAKHDHISDFCFQLWGMTDDLILDRNTGWYGPGEGREISSKSYKRAWPFSIDVNDVDLKYLEIYVERHGSPSMFSTADIYDNTEGESFDYPGTKAADIPLFEEITDENNETGHEYHVLRATFSDVSLSEGKYWIVLPEIGTDVDDYFDWYLEKEKGRGSLKSSDGGSSWTKETTKDYNLWFKLFGSKTYETFADSGTWTSEEITIEATDTFDKIYASYMTPTSTGVTISKREYYSDNGTATWHTYEDISSFPDTITDGTTQIQIKVELALNSASYPPSVDSIILTYSKSGDAGNRLHTGNVKGNYWISIEDYDVSGDIEESYILSRYGHWYKSDQIFYDYLPIPSEDNVCIGIGENPNETYRYIYYLDDSTASTWFEDDDTAVTVNTKVETGWLLPSGYIKQFRKLFLSVDGDACTSWGDEWIYTDKAWNLTGEMNNGITGLWKDGFYWYVLAYGRNEVFKYYGNFRYTGKSYSLVPPNETGWQMGLCKYGNYWYTLYYYRKEAGGDEYWYAVKWSEAWEAVDEYGICPKYGYNLTNLYRYNGYWYIINNYGSVKEILKCDDSFNIKEHISISNPDGISMDAISHQGDYWYIAGTKTTDIYRVYKYDNNWTKIDMENENIVGPAKALFFDGAFWYTGECPYRICRYSSIAHGSGDNILDLTIKTRGEERDAENPVENIHRRAFGLQGILQDYYFSLPTSVQGNRLRLILEGIGANWEFHDYEFEYWEKYRRNIINPMEA